MSTERAAAAPPQQEGGGLLSRPLLFLCLAFLVLYLRDQQPAPAAGKTATVVSSSSPGQAPLSDSMGDVLPSKPQMKVAAAHDEDDEFGDHNGQHQFSKPPPVVVTTTTSQAGGVPGLGGADSAALHYVRVSYCTSWGMKRNFLELQKFLERRYPSLIGSIEGGTYPPPPHAQMLSMLAGWLQLGSLAFMLFGSKLASWIGYAEEPEWLKQASENKGLVLVGVFMLNAVASSLSATGAFEIYLGEELVYSKLQTGRMPTANDVVAGLRALGMEPEA